MRQLLARLTKEKKRQIWNEIRAITTDPSGIKSMVREYCEKLHAHKFDNFNEID